MDYKLLLLLASLLIFSTYVITIWIKYGILPTISDSYYILPDNRKILFTLTLWAFSLPVIIVGATTSGINIMFFAGASICFVGASPLFKEHFEGRVHYVSAIIGIVLGLTSLWVNFGLGELVVTSVLLMLTIRILVKNNYTWWIEILAFLTIIIGLLLTL